MHHREVSRHLEMQGAKSNSDEYTYGSQFNNPGIKSCEKARVMEYIRGIKGSILTEEISEQPVPIPCFGVPVVTVSPNGTTTLQYPELPVFQRVFNPSPRDKTHNFRHNLEKSLVRSLKFHCLPPHTTYSSFVAFQLTQYHPLTHQILQN